MYQRVSATVTVGKVSGRLACLGAVLFGVLIVAGAQQALEAKPIVSDEPLSAEQLAVYRTILTIWYEGNKATFNLSSQTDPVDPNDGFSGKTCLKGFVLEKTGAAVVHHIRVEDSAQLGFANLHLVDPELQRKEVRENDPGKTMQEGRLVDDAVDNGFAHGLLSLGEIRFDKSHMHAIVSFSFVCGRLCGHGITMLMEKKNGVWTQKRQCGGYVS